MDPKTETLQGFLLLALILVGLFVGAAVVHWAARELGLL